MLSIEWTKLKMPLSPEVEKLLAEKTQNKELTDLLQRCKGLVSMSRSVMKDYYTQWDMNDAVYRGDRKPDDTDKKAVKRNEPSKVYLPLTHTQVQTFVSFAVMLLTQRDYFYELQGSGVEDVKPAKMCQAVIERDINYNKFKGVLLPQWLTDVARFGLGIFKSQWTKRTCPEEVQVPDPAWKPDPSLPVPPQAPTITQYQDKTEYLGNLIEVVSPYRWFPDTRLPLTRYRDGEFCADEIEKSFMDLKKLEEQGEVAGIDEVPRLPDSLYADRRLVNMSQGAAGTSTNAAYDPRMSPKDAAAYCIITEVELKCNPSKLEIGPGTFLNPDLDADVVVIVWIANDGRIVKLTDSGYDHNQFLFDAAQFFNDQNRVINFGIAELLGPMQDILDWLMNSRVTNVRKVIQNQLVVHPSYVEMQDLKDRNPIIRLKTAADGMAVDQYIKQLNVTDVTGGHINDMGVVQNFAEGATGLTENLLGQFAEGRRSAREASNVNANGSARVILPIKGLWEMGLLPLGQKLRSNIQQGLDIPQLVNVIGVAKFLANSQPDPTNPQGISPVQAFLPLDRSSLYGTYDFLIFDATLPSQRMAIASSLQEILQILSTKPELVFALGYDPKLILDEWFELQGVKNVERFALTPQRTQFLMQLASLARGGGGAPTAPGQGGGGPPSGPVIPPGPSGKGQR